MDETGEVEDVRQKYLYAMAELENARKRAARQSQEAAHEFKKRLLLKFLTVLDNLERAIAYQDSEQLRAGLGATIRGFESLLESEGVTPILTTGEHFDPRVAEAIGTQTTDEAESDTVIAEAQRGYLLDDGVLRPARVIVAKTE